MSDVSGVNNNARPYLAVCDAAVGKLSSAKIKPLAQKAITAAESTIKATKDAMTQAKVEAAVDNKMNASQSYVLEQPRDASKETSNGQRFTDAYSDTKTQFQIDGVLKFNGLGTRDTMASGVAALNDVSGNLFVGMTRDLGADVARNAEEFNLRCETSKTGASVTLGAADAAKVQYDSVNGMITVKHANGTSLRILQNDEGKWVAITYDANNKKTSAEIYRGQDTAIQFATGVANENGVLKLSIGNDNSLKGFEVGVQDRVFTAAVENNGKNVYYGSEVKRLTTTGADAAYRFTEEGGIKGVSVGFDDFTLLHDPAKVSFGEKILAQFRPAWKNQS